MKNKFKKLFNKITHLSSKKKILIYFGVCLICISSFYGLFTFSRYVIKNTYNNFLQSKEFYFYSSVLKDDNSANHIMHDWDGENDYQFVFDVKNYLDSLRWTKQDIDYETTINCTSSRGTVECASALTGTILTNELGGTTNQVNVTLSNPNNVNFLENDYVDMNVSISSTSPYSRTLRANFKIYVAKEIIRYSIVDEPGQKYLEFHISNNSRVQKKIRIGWNYNTMSVDNTNVLIQTGTMLTSTVNQISYASGNEFFLDSKKSLSIIFYKKDPSQNYTYPVTNPSSVITVMELPIT